MYVCRFVKQEEQEVGEQREAGAGEGRLPQRYTLLVYESLHQSCTNCDGAAIWSKHLNCQITCGLIFGKYCNFAF